MVDRPTVNDQPPDRATSYDALSELAQARRLTRVPVEEKEPQKAAGVDAARSAAHPVPVQFRLRTILWVMVAASVLFAVMRFIPAGGSAVLVWLLVLFVAHVTANFWGTRIAPGATQQGLAEEELDRGGSQHDRRQRAASAAVGAVRLSESARPGWPMFGVTAAGALVGGLVGGISLTLLSLDQAGYTGVIVGTVSAAVVGGFLGFLTSTFAQIALRAWNEALCGAASEPPARQTGNAGQS